jgi:hypothetical protein
MLLVGFPDLQLITQELLAEGGQVGELPSRPAPACQGMGWPKSGSKGRRSDGQTVPDGGVARSTR